MLAAPSLAPPTLLIHPAELLSDILSRIDTRELARLAATCRSLWLDAPTLPPTPVPQRDVAPVEAEMRRRAHARGLTLRSSRPHGARSSVQYLLKADRRDALRRNSLLAVGHEHSIFVDRAGGLLTCGVNTCFIDDMENGEEDGDQDAHVSQGFTLGHALDPDADPMVTRKIGPPTPVPAMQDRRIVSVATSGEHCLALCAVGEVYSWGKGGDGALGHADGRRAREGRA